MLAQVPYQELCSSDGQRLHQNDEKCLDETSALGELLGALCRRKIFKKKMYNISVVVTNPVQKEAYKMIEIVKNAGYRASCPI